MLLMQSRYVLISIHWCLSVNKGELGFQKFIWDTHLSVLNLYNKYIRLVSTLYKTDNAGSLVLYSLSLRLIHPRFYTLLLPAVMAYTMCYC